jgi:hypothetical protein
MQTAVEQNQMHEKKFRRKRSRAYYLWLLTGIAASIATVAGVILEHWATIKTWPCIMFPRLCEAKLPDFRCPATGGDSAMLSGRYLFRQEWPPGSPCDAESIIGELSERCEFLIAIRQRGANLSCRGIVDPKSKSFLTRGVTPVAREGELDCISGEFTEAVIETPVCGKGQLKILKRLDN